MNLYFCSCYKFSSGNSKYNHNQHIFLKFTKKDFEISLRSQVVINLFNDIHQRYVIFFNPLESSDYRKRKYKTEDQCLVTIIKLLSNLVLMLCS